MRRERQRGLVLEVPNRLSYSSVSKLSECGERWRLEYGRGITSGSWYSTVAGSVIHTITEQYDRLAIGGTVYRDLEDLDSFEELFRAEVAKELAEGVKLQPSGKKLESIGFSGGPNKKDLDWWLHYGPLYVQQWIEWRKANPEWAILEIPDEDGVVHPAIELEFTIDIGTEGVRGYIDRVLFNTETGEIRIVDLKSGKTPDSKLQLADYGVALAEQYGIKADTACYWVVYQPREGGEVTEHEEPMLDEAGEPVLYKSGPRKGEPRMRKVTTKREPGLKSRLTKPVPMVLYTKEFMVARYEAARAIIMAGAFLPNPTGMCRGCGVRQYCRAFGGEKAPLMPVREDFVAMKQYAPEPELTDSAECASVAIEGSRDERSKTE